DCTSQEDALVLLLSFLNFHQMLLDKVMWPVRDTDDEEDCEASSDTLVQLLRFWAGWEVLPSEIQVEISGGIFVLHQRAWRH
ncbi:hypothetical protein XENOCAPTIV_002575, partial [Xenoophorus captivus]